MFISVRLVVMILVVLILTDNVVAGTIYDRVDQALDQSASNQSVVDQNPTIYDGYSETANKIKEIESVEIKKAREACMISQLGISTWVRQGNGSLLSGSGMTAGQASVENLRQVARFNIQARSQMNQAVATKYPGSSFDCLDERGRVSDGNRETTFEGAQLKLYVERNNPITYTMAYNALNTIVAVSDGRQSIEIVVDLIQPARSYFNDAQLTVSASSSGHSDISGGMINPADSIGQKGGYGVGFNVQKNELIEALNRGYLATKGTMIDYARALILQPEMRETLCQTMIRSNTDREATKKRMSNKKD